MWTWQSFYDTGTYLVGAVEERFFDTDPDNLATLLGISGLELLDRGFGTNWQEVQSRDLDHSQRWFTQGDPWNALLGVGRDSVTVTGLDLTIAGLAGPGTLRTHGSSFRHDKSDLVAIHESIVKVRQAMQHRWRRCPDCQSQRVGNWCTCDGPLRGICYD